MGVPWMPWSDIFFVLQDRAILCSFGRRDLHNRAVVRTFFFSCSLGRSVTARSYVGVSI